MSTLAPHVAPAAVQHLTFRVGGETFAMPIARIREIRQFQALTEVPLMPPFIRGVMNLRGSVVPIIDLSSRFQRGQTKVARRTSLIVVDVPSPRGAVVLGLMVEQVEEVVDLDLARVTAAPAFGSDLRPEFVAGIINVGARLIILLEIGHVLAVEELARLASESPHA